MLQVTKKEINMSKELLSKRQMKNRQEDITKTKKKDRYVR